MAKVTVQNADRAIKPGMVCDVTFENEMKEKLVVIPYTAVTTDDHGNTFVYTVSPENSKVKKQIIEVGPYQKDGLTVLSGLAVDQMIVVEGKEKVTDNSQINL
jgi:multidrug efflux pump subunit AcrA (membrane-fusion protein)